MAITIKMPAQIEKMKIAGALAAKVLEMVTPYVVPGVTTDKLNTICHNYIVNIQKSYSCTTELSWFSKIDLHLY